MSESPLWSCRLKYLEKLKLRRNKNQKQLTVLDRLTDSVDYYKEQDYPHLVEGVAGGALVHHLIDDVPVLHSEVIKISECVLCVLEYCTTEL